MTKELSAYFFVATDPSVEIGGSNVEVVISDTFNNAVKVIGMKYNPATNPAGYSIECAGSVLTEDLKSYISEMEAKAGLRNVFVESTPKHAIPKTLEPMAKKMAQETVKECKQKFVYGLKMALDKTAKSLTPAERKTVEKVISKFESKVNLVK